MAIKGETNYQHQYRNYNFKGKRENENIILIMRRHWLVAVINFLPILIYLAGIAGVYILVFQAEAVFRIFTDPNLVGLVETFLFFVFWIATFIIWIDYYLDTWIITDQRIINVEQHGLFRRHISELEHGKVQDVTTEVQGFFPTLLQFGYVYVQTAGEKERFVFKQVPDPTRVRKVVMQLQKYAILEEKKKEGEILRGKL